MKFDMGATTLSTLTTQTQGSSDDLGQLIRQLIDAAQPLEKQFSGEGKRAFDGFKLRADLITAELNGSLGAIIGGQGGMDVSYQTGDADMSTNARTSEGSANFSAASFRSR